MKTIATLGLALGLSASAFAGDSIAPATLTPATTSSPLLNWFAGGSVGYLLDNEEEFYTLHAGATFAESGALSHSLYLEAAFAQFSNFGLETDILPVTLNYKLDYSLNDSFSLYAGAGIGAGFIDNELGPFDDSSTELAAQIFAGATYKLCSNFELFSGVRWIWIDDSNFFGAPIEVGDDFGVELGGRFNF